MGRRHYSERTPQHSRHAHELKLLQDQGLPPKAAFGIRRFITSPSAVRIGLELRRLQVEGELPQELRIEQRPAVSVLPLEILGRQISKGIVRHDPGTIKKAVERKCRRIQNSPLEAEITGVHARSGALINMAVASAELYEERADIAQVLGSYGVRGLGHLQKPLSAVPERDRRLQVTIARYPRVMPLEIREETKAIIHSVVDEVHGQENPIMLQQWNVYPDLDRLAA